jgi:2'-5' RNA ligase
MLGVESEQTRVVRVFVGLRIGQDVADVFAERARLIESAPTRFVAREDIHLTGLPPWDEACIGKVIQKLRAALRGLKPFTLVFTHLSYWPNLRHPRLLCAECLPSDALTSLQEALLSAFGQTEDKPFRPHVTLARMQRGARAARGRNKLEEELRLVQAVDSVQLFQSSRNIGKGYQVLISLPLAAPRRKWSDLLEQEFSRIIALWDSLTHPEAGKAAPGKDRSQRDMVSTSGASKCCNS